MQLLFLSGSKRSFQSEVERIFSLEHAAVISLDRRGRFRAKLSGFFSLEHAAVISLWIEEIVLFERIFGFEHAAVISLWIEEVVLKRN